MKPYHVPLCPVSATTLFGEQNDISMGLSNYKEKRDNLGEWPVTFVASNAREVMVAETVNGKDTVWRVKMSPEGIDRFVLPHQHFLKYNGLVQSALSPDGEVYAMLLQQREIGFPYFVDNYVFKGTDVLVLGTHPLRLLGTIPREDSSFTTGLAVDHRDGKARVLVYRKGQWDHREFAE